LVAGLGTTGNGDLSAQAASYWVEFAKKTGGQMWRFVPIMTFKHAAVHL
jgi:hypothetical protein